MLQKFFSAAPNPTHPFTNILFLMTLGSKWVSKLKNDHRVAFVAIITAAPQARERAHLYAAILAMRYIRHSKERGRLEYACDVYFEI